PGSCRQRSTRPTGTADRGGSAAPTWSSTRPGGASAKPNRRTGEKPMRRDVFVDEFARKYVQLDEQGQARAMAMLHLMVLAGGNTMPEADRRTCLTQLGRAKLGRHEAYQVIAGRKTLEP